MFFTVILLIFSVIVLFFGVFFMFWWKNYGKQLFFILKNLNSSQNTPNFTKNLNNLSNLEKFYQNMDKYGGQMGNIDQKFDDFKSKITKNTKK